MKGSAIYFNDIDFVHDILKILNLRNYFVSED